MSLTLDDSQLHVLLQNAVDGDDVAREAVLERHLPLVRSLAARYAGRGEPLEDLVQVGSVGLVLALDRFDPERGVPFRSFAIPTIVGEIRRHFRDRAWALHVPRRLKELSLELSKATGSLTAELGRSPSVGELAEYLDVGEEDVIEALEISNAYSTRSLSEPQFEDRDDESYRAALADTETGYLEVEDMALIEGGMATLDQRSRRIVELRFYGGRTQSEIATEVGISQMHVSRLLRQALEVMRASLEIDEEEP